MAFEAVTDSRTAAAIRAARRRVVLLAPGIWPEVGEALAWAMKQLGPASVTVVVDADPEVFRLGYGDFDALSRLQKRAAELAGVICQERGVRISVLIADDRISVSAPQPRLVAAERGDGLSGFTLNLDAPAEHLVSELGAGPAGEADRKVGLDGISLAKVAEIEKDLRENPPQKFDIAQRVRVFNAAIEFIDLEVSGCHVTRKEVTLPKYLIPLASKDVRDRLKSSYRLIDKVPEVEQAENKLLAHRKRIEKRFLRTVPGYGMAVLRRERERFDRAVGLLEKRVDQLQKAVDATIEASIKKTVDEIARALTPGVCASPPEEYKSWSARRRAPCPEDFVWEELMRCFDRASAPLGKMSVRLVPKGVTWELLQREDFAEKAAIAFPELRKRLCDEFDAAKAATARKLEELRE